MAKENQGNPDFVSRPECERLHSGMDDRLERIEASVKDTNEKATDSAVILNNGLGEKLDDHIAEHKRYKWALWGIFATIVGQWVYQVVAG